MSLTKSKARRQRNKKNKYESAAPKIAKKKEVKAKKAVAKKKEWVAKDVKKNGSYVKGGLSHKALVDKIIADAKEAQEKREKQEELMKKTVEAITA